MAKTFKYEDKQNIVLPNPMSVDKSVIRTSLIPSLLNVYDYNKKRNIDNILLYEISKTYDANYNRLKLCSVLIAGSVAMGVAGGISGGYLGQYVDGINAVSKTPSVRTGNFADTGSVRSYSAIDKLSVHSSDSVITFAPKTP